MMAGKFWADPSNMGDGWEDPQHAARMWNRHIRPILVAETEDEEEMISYAAQWAWEEFCGREAGDDESLVMALAEELEAKINNAD